jgi:hypothetical protein
MSQIETLNNTLRSRQISARPAVEPSPGVQKAMRAVFNIDIKEWCLEPTTQTSQYFVNLTVDYEKVRKPLSAMHDEKTIPTVMLGALSSTISGVSNYNVKCWINYFRL